MTAFIQNAASAASSQFQRAASSASGAASAVTSSLNDAVDRRIPPERRSEIYGNAQGWAQRNPRLAAFVFLQFALSGLPILTFVGFSLFILLSSLATCLVTALIVSLSFTAFCVGGAFLILLPIVIVSTTTATFFFVTGLIASILLEKMRESETPVPTVAELQEIASGVIRRARGSWTPAEDAKSSISGIPESKVNGKVPSMANGTAAATDQTKDVS